MRAFRHRRLLVCLAMLVFAMQGLLAFAHTHTHSSRAAGLGLAARAITYGMCRLGSEKPCPPPAQRNDHAKCQICSLMALASAGVLELPPVITPRQSFGTTPGPIASAQLVESAAARHFQARAPPVA